MADGVDILVFEQLAQGRYIRPGASCQASHIVQPGVQDRLVDIADGAIPLRGICA